MFHKDIQFSVIYDKDKKNIVASHVFALKNGLIVAD